MAHDENHSKGVAKLGDLIKDIRFAMLTTADDQGHLRSRPMTTQHREFDGDLWFFTGRSTPKVGDISHDQKVNVSYAAPDDDRYVSISGIAQIVEDREKMKEFWNPAYKVWFPDGVEDPDLVLVKVEVEEAEYWDAPSNAMVKLFGFVKALATGGEYDQGENARIDLKGS